MVVVRVAVLNLVVFPVTVECGVEDVFEREPELARVAVEGLLELARGRISMFGSATRLSMMMASMHVCQRLRATIKMVVYIYLQFLLLRECFEA